MQYTRNRTITVLQRTRHWTLSQENKCSSQRRNRTHSDCLQWLVQVSQTTPPGTVSYSTFDACSCWKLKDSTDLFGKTKNYKETKHNSDETPNHISVTRCAASNVGKDFEEVHWIVWHKQSRSSLCRKCHFWTHNLALFQIRHSFRAVPLLSRACKTSNNIMDSLHASIKKRSQLEMWRVMRMNIFKNAKT